MGVEGRKLCLPKIVVCKICAHRLSITPEPLERLCAAWLSHHLRLNPSELRRVSFRWWLNDDSVCASRHQAPTISHGLAKI
jgi:hypothetical protein